MLTSLIAIAAGQAAAQPPPPPIVSVPQPPPITIRPPVMMPPPPPPPPPPPTPPMAPPRQIAGSIAADDYPAAAMRARQQGTVRTRIGVGANGRITECTVVGSSGSSILDAATCRLISQRFRYEPARLNGRPVASTISRNVVWRMPEEPKIAFAQGRFSWTVTASPAGVTDCDATLTGATFAEFDEGSCLPWLVARTELEPGQPSVKVTQVLSLLPQGEALTLLRLPGTPFWENVGELQIAPDGTVTACTTTSQRGEVPDYVTGWFVPLCESLLNVRHFSPASDGQARRARMQSAIFVEVQGSGSVRR